MSTFFRYWHWIMLSVLVLQGCLLLWSYQYPRESGQDMDWYSYYRGAFIGSIWTILLIDIIKWVVDFCEYLGFLGKAKNGEAGSSGL